MKSFFLFTLLLAAILGLQSPAGAQVRSVVRDSVDFSAELSSDTTWNLWPTLLTVTWKGSLAPDTLKVRYITAEGAEATMPLYDPLTDAVDTLLVRARPEQAVYLYWRKYHRVYVRRGTLRANSAAVITFE